MSPLTTDQIMQQKDDQLTFADRVMFIFKAKAVPLTPWQVYSVYQAWFGPCLIGSVRRQITKLTDMGYLSQTVTRVIGPYKAWNGTWVIANLKKL